ncbi:MAG TPA: hypothetical protein VMA09_12830 [Candidatus Binataceae bacterium]|nr:hypothetical protein [Candidatus Binataceae bacterium]
MSIFVLSVLKSGIPASGIGVFAMTADQALAEIEDLHPPGLDNPARRADKASLVSKHDDGIATENEFVAFKFLKIEHCGQGPKVLFDFRATAPWMRPRHTRHSRRKKFHIGGDRTQQRRQVALGESLVSALYRLQIVLFAHHGSPSQPHHA